MKNFADITPANAIHSINGKSPAKVLRSKAATAPTELVCIGGNYYAVGNNKNIRLYFNTYYWVGINKAWTLEEIV